MPGTVAIYTNDITEALLLDIERQGFVLAIFLAVCYNYVIYQYEKDGVTVGRHSKYDSMTKEEILAAMKERNKRAAYRAAITLTVPEGGNAKEQDPSAIRLCKPVAIAKENRPWRVNRFQETRIRARRKHNSAIMIVPSNFSAGSDLAYLSPLVAL